MDTKERVLTKLKELVERGQQLTAREWTKEEYTREDNVIAYIRFRTEALNLTKRACGEHSEHYQELRRQTEDEDRYLLPRCVGAVEAAAADFEAGLLFDMRALIAAELLGDFIEQAEYLLGEGYCVAAASLAGAVLEDALRRLCRKHSIPVPEKSKIGTLNSELAKKGIYGKLVLKMIVVFADIRNNADHGHPDKFSRDDVQGMIRWITRFMADYLG